MSPISPIRPTVPSGFGAEPPSVAAIRATLTTVRSGLLQLPHGASRHSRERTSRSARAEGAWSPAFSTSSASQRQWSRRTPTSASPAGGP